jgi:hypothetical protein
MEATVTNPTKPRVPITQRINFRMIAVAAVVLFLVGYPIYTYLDSAISGGVHNIGNGMKAVDLKSLGNFPFDEKVGTIKDIPEKWRALDGQKVVLEGFMYAGNSAADNIHSFQFVYNVAKCCFGGPPRVQERVFTVVPGGTVPYFFGEMVRCTGTLHVAVVKNEAGEANSVYTMDLDKLSEL